MTKTINLKELRKKRRLTQHDVAVKACISQSMYSSIENGSRKPSVDVAKRLGQILRISWTKFYPDEKGA